MWQIFVTAILQIFHRTDMYICTISVTLVRENMDRSVVQHVIMKILEIGVFFSHLKGSTIVIKALSNWLS